MRSSEGARRIAILLLLLGSAACSDAQRAPDAGRPAAAAASHPATPAYPAAGATQCTPQETVLFSCETGKKVVSLCATGKPGAIESVAYRYGLPGKVELEYKATPSNGLLFHGQVEPAAPNASVREVWFDKGSTRYLVTACEGGDCPVNPPSGQGLDASIALTAVLKSSSSPPILWRPQVEAYHAFSAAVVRGRGENVG